MNKIKSKKDIAKHITKEDVEKRWHKIFNKITKIFRKQWMGTEAQRRRKRVDGYFNMTFESIKKDVLMLIEESYIDVFCAKERDVLKFACQVNIVRNCHLSIQIGLDNMLYQVRFLTVANACIELILSAFDVVMVDYREHPPFGEEKK